MDGTPAAGIRVTAQAVPEGPTAAGAQASVLAAIVQTDSAGRYRLDTVPVGRYYIAAGLVDFPTYYPGVVAIGEAKTVVVTSSAAVTGIDFSLARPQALKISGRIVRDNPAAAPLPGPGGFGGFGNVAAERVVIQGVQRQIVTPSADGSFESTNLGPGDYTVFLQPTNGLQPQVIKLRDKDEVVELRVPRVATLSGRLLMDTEGARPRVGLVLVDEASGNRINVTISSAGTYQAVIPLGSYRVETQQPLLPGFTMKSMMNGTVDLMRNPLKVADGDTPWILVTLGVSSPPPWVRVSGRVVGWQPTTGAQSGRERVQMTGANAGEILEAAVNEGGTFAFPSVLPGQYVARYSNPAFGFTAADQITIDIPAAGLANLEIKTAAIVEIPGRVEVLGNPRFSTTGPPLRISFTSTSSRGQSRSSASPVTREGAFALTTTEDTTRLALTNVPVGFTLKALTYGSANLLTDEVKLVPGDGKELRVVFEALTTGAFRVSGKVTGLTPMRTLSVTLNGRPQSRSALINPDDGTFEFAQVFPGNYTVQALANPPGVTVSASVTVTTADIFGIELRIPPSRRVTGRTVLEGAGDFQGRFAFTITGNNVTTTVSPTWQPDGSFQMALPEGESRIGITGLHPDLTVKTLRYGETDLLTGSAKVSASDTQQLSMTLVSSPGATLVRLTGRYIAPPAPAQGAPLAGTIRLNGQMTIETPLRADGTFEFPRVLPGTYQWCCPYGSSTLTIPTKESASITIRSIKGRVAFEVARNTFEGLGLVRAADGSGVSSGLIQPDGTFILTLQDGAEYGLAIPALPTGFYIKSVRYGTADITNRPLSVASGADALELQITVSN